MKKLFSEQTWQLRKMRATGERMKNNYEWPYPNEFGVRETIESDLLVLGGGLAGCERAAPRAAGPAWPRLTYNITLKVDVWATFSQLAEMCRNNVLR